MDSEAKKLVARRGGPRDHIHGPVTIAQTEIDLGEGGIDTSRCPIVFSRDTMDFASAVRPTLPYA